MSSSNSLLPTSGGYLVKYIPDGTVGNTVNVQTELATALISGTTDLSTGTGNDVIITAGEGTGSGNSGNVIIQSKEAAGSGNDGGVHIKVGDYTCVWPTNAPVLGQTLAVTDVTSGVVTMQFVNPPVNDTLLNQNARLFIPFYKYPDVTQYNAVGTAMEDLEGRCDVVINPNNGNDATSPPSGDWTTGLNRIQTQAGAYWDKNNMYGYTYTDSGTRDINTVKGIITGYFTQGWEAWINGIFFDETSSNEIYYDYYLELTNFVVETKSDANVCLNCGGSTYQAMIDLPALTCIMTREGTANFWEEQYYPTQYQLLYPDRNRFVAANNSEADSTRIL